MVLLVQLLGKLVRLLEQVKVVHLLGSVGKAVQKSSGSTVVGE